MKQTTENLKECDFIQQIEEKCISRTANAGLIYKIGNQRTSKRVMTAAHIGQTEPD